MLIDVHKQLSVTFNKKFNYPINSAKFASQLEWISSIISIYPSCFSRIETKVLLF